MRGAWPGGAAARRRLYVNLHPAAWPKRGLSPLNRFLAATICLAVLVAVLESEPLIHEGREGWFLLAEIAFALIFAAEYAARVWTAAENPLFSDGWRGRVRYVLTVPALIDFLAVSTLFLTFFGETSLLRLFRLLRILSLAKLGRFSAAMRAIGDAIRSRRYELLVSLAVAGLLLLASSTLLFIFEGAGQPDAFGSIPRAMWWSVATLTTVGYGDAVPATAAGKLLAGLTAVTGIGVIAIPTGILASAFSEAIQRQRAQGNAQGPSSTPR